MSSTRKIKVLKGFTALVHQEEDETVPVHEKEHLSVHREFDFNGNCLKEFMYTASGEMEKGAEHDFDEAGQVVEARFFVDEDTVGERYVYHLDGDGLRIGTDIYYADGSISRETVARDGQRITTVRVDEDGDLENEIIRIYDAEDRLIEHLVRDESKEITERLVYAFDERGLQESTHYYAGEDLLLYKTFFEYDREGRVIEQITYNPDDSVARFVQFVYNRDGSLASQQVNEDYITHYTYDKEGRTVREETQGVHDELRHALKVFVYDREGLLMEEISYEMGQQFEMEPMVMGRLPSHYLSTRFEYEFF